MRLRYRAVLAPLFVLLAIGGGADVSRTAYGLTPAPALRHRPIVIRHLKDGTASSYNWSGYAVTASSKAVTDVKGSWVVPAINGGCPASNEYAAFWVGIDGFSSNTVEQAGTDSDCQNGVPAYYAWFEFYPHPAFLVNNFPIKPGDVISADVSYSTSNGRFTVALTNTTTGQTFSTSTKVKAQRSSAEWIAEAPSSSGGILPLADFGTASFGADSTGVPSTSDATVSGTTGPIGAFGNIVQITMVGNSGQTKAAPSPLSTDGSSFSDTWYDAGP